MALLASMWKAASVVPSLRLNYDKYQEVTN